MVAAKNWEAHLGTVAGNIQSCCSKQFDQKELHLYDAIHNLRMLHNEEIAFKV